jgi:hypothetical protein
MVFGCVFRTESKRKRKQAESGAQVDSQTARTRKRAKAKARYDAVCRDRTVSHLDRNIYLLTRPPSPTTRDLVAKVQPFSLREEGGTPALMFVFSFFL